MINVVFSRNVAGFFCSFCIRGHSGFAELGRDIVCAAVSSASYLVVNTVVDVMHVRPRKLVFSDGSLIFALDDAGSVACSFLLKGFFLHLKAMAEQYPGNLSIKYGKVV